MAGFGTNKSSITEGKTLRSNHKQVKPAEQEKSTSESTGPDTARLETDKAGQEATNPKQVTADEGDKPAEQRYPTPESTPGPDAARLENDKAGQKAAAQANTALVDKGKGRMPPQAAVPTETASNGESGQQTRGYTDQQKDTVDRVLKLDSHKYYQILGVTDKTKSKEAYKSLVLLVHPDKNKYTGAEEAFIRINEAAKALNIPLEDFAENAYGEEDGADGSSVPMDIDQSEAPKPDDFCQNIYREATPYLGALLEDLSDVSAKSKLKQLNKQIEEQAIKDGLSLKDFQDRLIPIETFVGHFQSSLPYINALKIALKMGKTDEIARQKLKNTNNLLGLLNKQRGYPEDWQITVPGGSDEDEGESSKASKDSEKSGQASSKGGVKTKVNVLVEDEWDGRTSLGEVVYVIEVGFGSRVIVNRGTDQNPYFEIHPGADFGKGVAKDWLQSGIYEYENLPKDTEGMDMKIYGRVKVKRSDRTKERRPNGMGIVYYMIGVRGKNYVSTRSTLTGMKGLGPAKVKRIDNKLDRQNEQLLVELDKCRANNEHPDTGEQLTSEDILMMPWLSSDTTEVRGAKLDEDDDDEVIQNMVPQNNGLKRK